MVGGGVIWPKDSLMQGLHQPATRSLLARPPQHSRSLLAKPKKPIHLGLESCGTFMKGTAYLISMCDYECYLNCHIVYPPGWSGSWWVSFPWRGRGHRCCHTLSGRSVLLNHWCWKLFIRVPSPPPSPSLFKTQERVNRPPQARNLQPVFELIHSHK